MGVLEVDALYPPSQQTEQAWAWLRQHVAWVEGFWLVFVFTDSPPQAEVLRQRLMERLEGDGGRMRCIQPRSPSGLREALQQLTDGDDVTCTWLEAVRRDPLHYSEREEPWAEAWQHVLLRANERREQLRGRGGGLVFVARSELKGMVREAAPDLWSVHDKVLELDPVCPAGFDGRATAAIATVERTMRDQSLDWLEFLGKVANLPLRRHMEHLGEEVAGQRISRADALAQLEVAAMLSTPLGMAVREHHRAASFMALGSAFSRVPDEEGTMRSLERALAIVQGISEDSPFARTSLQLVRARSIGQEILEGHFDGAERMCQNALRELQPLEAEEWTLVALFLRLLALIYWGLGRVPELEGVTSEIDRMSDGQDELVPLALL